jgi:hypothetical protein
VRVLWEDEHRAWREGECLFDRFFIAALALAVNMAIGLREAKRNDSKAPTRWLFAAESSLGYKHVSKKSQPEMMRQITGSPGVFVYICHIWGKGHAFVPEREAEQFGA